jgi:hypothetical protein
VTTYPRQVEPQLPHTPFTLYASLAWPVGDNVPSAGGTPITPLKLYTLHFTCLASGRQRTSWRWRWIPNHPTDPQSHASHPSHCPHSLQAGQVGNNLHFALSTERHSQFAFMERPWSDIRSLPDGGLKGAAHVSWNCLGGLASTPIRIKILDFQHC